MNVAEALRAARHADELVRDLGAPLARWLLTPEARETIGLTAPKIPAERGAAVALFVWEDAGVCDSGLAAEGFALPLAWRVDVGDDPRLPPGLVKAAEGARRAVEISGWGLTLHHALGDTDLREWPLACESAWAPLAAALIVARDGGQPSGRVLATGCWSDAAGELLPVRGVEAKVEAAARLFGAEGGSVFVPEQNFDAARKAALQESAEVEISAYPRHETRYPRRVLGRHLEALHAPPSGGDPLEQRLAFVNLPYVRANSARKRELYLRLVLRELAERLHGSVESVGRIALCLSFNYELCVLLIEALRPARALLLTTRETEQNVADVTARVAAACEPLLIEPGAEEQTIAMVRDWLAQEADPSRRAVDVTGGTKAASAALIAAAQETGARILYLEHDYDGSTPVVGKERVRTLSWLSRPGA